MFFASPIDQFYLECFVKHIFRQNNVDSFSNICHTASLPTSSLSVAVTVSMMEPTDKISRIVLVASEFSNRGAFSFRVTVIVMFVVAIVSGLKSSYTMHVSWKSSRISSSLQLRHNERDGVSNHQLRDCLPSRLFKAQIKENIKVPCHWPLWGEFTGDRWIHHTKGQ